QIRLQWWREAIAGIYIGKPPAHAVVRALADAVERCNPSRVRFDRLIDAREFDLEDRQPNTVEDLIVYADATSGELTSLTLEMLGACDDITLTKGRHAGVVWALNGLLRAIPFHAAQRRCFLPKSLTDKYDISIDKLYEGNPDNNLVHAVLELATVAAHHLVQAQDDRYEMEIIARPAFSCLTVVAADLKKLQKAGFDVYSVLPMGPLRRRWLLSTAISWRNLIGRV
ncbi:squalene/phytoene synthase family protein, partial [Alphaproteobacteria bacterium]|nr:squalene/phytoene synthase family protein [Alphaproteobacteria bacterium]